MHRTGFTLITAIFSAEKTDMKYNLKDKKILLQWIKERKNIRIKLKNEKSLPFTHFFLSFTHFSPFCSLGAGNTIVDKCFDLCKQRETYNWATSRCLGSWCPRDKATLLPEMQVTAHLFFFPFFFFEGCCCTAFWVSHFIHETFQRRKENRICTFSPSNASGGQ